MKYHKTSLYSYVSIKYIYISKKIKSLDRIVVGKCQHGEY